MWSSATVWERAELATLHPQIAHAFSKLAPIDSITIAQQVLRRGPRGSGRSCLIHEAYPAVHALQPLTEELQELQAVVEDLAGLSFNGVLLNLYRDGQDSVG